MENSLNTTSQAKKLVTSLGLIFLVLTLNELGKAFMSKRVDFFSLLVLISITAGMFARQAWSRILGILYSLFLVLLMIFFTALIIFPMGDSLGTVQSDFPLSLSVLILGITALINIFIIYVLFRPDVKELFKTQKKD